ncbi:MAG TPA: glycosyltransferase family 4 protein [Bacillota bacterium]|nr:glycosyltransferase family 4 protein [Bacillota bacterium]
MKIAMIADRLTMGGLETHLITVINELLRRGHQVLLDTAFIAPEIRLQIRDYHHDFQQVDWSASPVEDLRGFRPDVIHAHPFTAIFRGYEAAHSMQKPLFVTMHGLYDFGLDRSPMGNLVCGKVKRVIAVDHGVAELLSRSIAHPEKISVIYNGIDFNQFQPKPLQRLERVALGLHPEWPTLVVVSRIADGKERTIFQLLDCVATIATQLEGLNVLIVGGGSCFTQLQARLALLADAAKLRVLTVGQQMEVLKYLTLADLILACDRAAMEALASRKPVFAINAAGFAGIINTANFENILLYRRGYRQFSQDELTQELVGLLQDLPALNQRAQEGYAIVRSHFDIEKVVGQLVDLYQKV